MRNGRSSRSRLSRPRHELLQRIAAFRPGDHLCLLYDTPQEQFAVVVPFIRDGLAKGHRCLYIVDDRTAEEVVAALRRAGVDVDAEMRRGAFELLTKREAYLKSGRFDPPRMIGVLRKSTRDALARGFTALRATGEMTWALGREPGVDRLIEYEARLNDFFPDSAALGICQYNRRRFPPEIVREVLLTHPIAIVGGRVCRNIYFEPAAAVLGRQTEAKRVDWMLHQLRETADATDELARRADTIRESRRRLALHVRRTPVGVIEWDPRFRVRAWNPAATRVFGYRATEAIGRPAELIVPPQGRAHVDQIWHALLERRGGRRETVVNRTKDGRVLACEWTSTTLVDQAGKVTGVATLVQDVTEARRAEEALRRSEAGLKEAQRIGHFGSWELDLPSGEQRWSDEVFRILEADPGTRGPSVEVFMDAVHPEDRDRFQRAYSGTLKSGMPYDLTHRLLMPDGRVKYVHGQGATYRDAAGKPVRSVGVLLDITEQQRAELEIRRLNRLYRVLTQTNEMLLRAETPQALLQEACRIAVEVGSVSMAWAGFVDEETGIIRPIASHGDVAGYLEGLLVTTDPGVPEGRGPGGLAVREGRPVVCRDVEHDPVMAPWRDRSLALGYRSSGSFPLRLDGTVKGLFAVYSSDTDWCYPEGVALIAEMADDISFALTHLEQERRRSEAEAARSASEAEYRRLVDEAPYAVYRVMRGGRLLAVNPAFVRMLGCPSAEAALRLVMPRDVWVHPHEREQLISGRVDNAEVTWRRMDGAHIHVRLRLRAVRGADGAIECYEGYGEDVTERWAAETAQRASEAEYRRLVDEAPYAVYRTDREGRLLAVNPAFVRILGYPSAEDALRIDLGRDVFVEAGEREQLLREHLEPAEVTWRRRDGTHIHVRLRVRGVAGADGTIECYEGYGEDVTEKWALENRLRQAQKMEAIGQLAAGVSHDFNNLLATILTCSELVASDLPAEAPSREDFDNLREAAQHGADLTRKLMVFSRQQPLELQTVSMDALVADFARMVRRLLPEDVELAIDAGAPAVMTRADSGAIHQILMNLATNARDAMPAGGKLLIAVGRTSIDADHVQQNGWGEVGDFVTLTVSDTGSGMDAETQRHLFEPFFTTKPVGQGTGLGMSMVYGLVRQHGGFLTVTTEPGQGTTVRVYVPAVPCPEAAAAAAAAAELRGGSETIMIVEDNEGLRRAAARILEKHGYAVLTARDGAEALKVLADRQTDLIVTDVVMPRLGGPQLVQALTHSGRAPRVVFTSGYPARDVVGRAHLGPGTPILVKPWSGADLLRTVREVLDRPLPD